ncbi:hypothetical protein FAGAP_9475 [Fusarium agapanthi]|uniref:F-box domain-containing protein n=1 Tax=Fusarium agapanthi TaxID=1803897 RepID=A0A9P5B9B3_9HYPO|nr:hypothetical protein FAGAP_9475 [Fusarium agapanthi]
MSLVTLPQELLAEVFSLDHGLSRRDLKSLRLTCRQVSSEASCTLFYQVRISPLIQDFQHFFELSESPLASLVRVLVWEELTFDLTKFQHPWYTPPVLYNENGDENKSFSREMTGLVYFHFMVGLQDVSAFAGHPDPVAAHMMHHSRRPIPKSKSPDEFLSAVRNNMPNLHTLVSRPMDGQRCLEIPSLDFSMTISSLENILQGHGTNIRYNTGFTDYFMPLLESLASQPNDEAPTNKITHLFYSDEDVDPYSALLQMEEPMKLNIFEHLLDRLVIASADDINNDDDDYCSQVINLRSSFDRETHEHLDEQAKRRRYLRTHWSSTQPLVSFQPSMIRVNEHGIAHSLGPRRIHHLRRGYGLTQTKFFYDPVTDKEVNDPFDKQEKPKDDSWTVQGQHTWDSETGLWRDGQGKLKKFVTERELPERPKVLAEDQDSDFNTDMQPTIEKKTNIFSESKTPRGGTGGETQKAKFGTGK